MNLAKLIEWQWSDYEDKHRNRTNLLIHIVAVPLFWVGIFEILGALTLMLFGVPTFRMIFWALVLMGIALGAEAYGHSLEGSAPHPAKDKAELIQRLVVEQLVNFPRFVLTGGWLRNLKAPG